MPNYLKPTTMYDICKRISEELGLDYSAVFDLCYFYFKTNLKEVIKNEDKNLQIVVDSLCSFSFFKNENISSPRRQENLKLDGLKRAIKEYEDMINSNTLSSEDKGRALNGLKTREKKYFHIMNKNRKYNSLCEELNNYKEQITEFEEYRKNYDETKKTSKK